MRIVECRSGGSYRHVADETIEKEVTEMLIYWIWFAELKNLSCSQKKMLLQHFRDPEEIYHSDTDALKKVAGMKEDMLAAIEDKSLSNAERILTECSAKGITILTLRDKTYPGRLKNTFDPPVVLYCKGKLPDWGQIPIIGIVGTRKSTPYGMRAAHRFGGQIAACGGTVVSGGAAGIDTMALEGALAAGGSVLCVFGCGVDVSYPARNKKLFEEIAVRGCLISEYPPKTEPLSWHFPRRNRIISGLSNGVLVVEAPQKSGALITARLAMEQGREVFAVPGNVDMESCAGSNALLQDYGIAALSGWDVMKEYEALYPGRIAQRDVPKVFERPSYKVAQSPVIPRPADTDRVTGDKKSIDKEEKSTYSVVNNSAAALNEQEQAVLNKISREPVFVDDVINASGLSAGTVKAILTKLTVKGWLQNHPGGRISRK